MAGMQWKWGQPNYRISLRMDRTVTTSYYFPLHSLVTAILTLMSLVCLDSAVPAKLALLEALKVLTFIIAIFGSLSQYCWLLVDIARD
jgi:hypothetical protein